MLYPMHRGYPEFYDVYGWVRSIRISLVSITGLLCQPALGNESCGGSNVKIGKFPYRLKGPEPL